MDDIALEDSERGASAVEYGLLVALIAAVIVIAVMALGGVTTDLFAETCDKVDAGLLSTGQTTDGCS